jgi:hypothetical protein
MQPDPPMEISPRHPDLGKAVNGSSRPGSCSVQQAARGGPRRRDRVVIAGAAQATCSQWACPTRREASIEKSPLRKVGSTGRVVRRENSLCLQRVLGEVEDEPVLAVVTIDRCSRGARSCPSYLPQQITSSDPRIALDRASAMPGLHSRPGPGLTVDHTRKRARHPPRSGFVQQI